MDSNDINEYGKPQVTSLNLCHSTDPDFSTTPLSISSFPTSYCLAGHSWELLASGNIYVDILYFPNSNRLLFGKLPNLHFDPWFLIL